MSGKSKIKHDVFRPHFFSSVRAIPRLAGDGKTNFIPKPEKRDSGATIANARYVIEDTGVRMHAFNNVHKVNPAERAEGEEGAGDDADEDFDATRPANLTSAAAATGYYVENMYGTALLQFVLAPVRKAFASHARIKTFIIVMDKSIFMPRPKTYVQMGRTNTMLRTMEAQQIKPIVYNPGEIPEIIAADKIIPPWIAVRADRTLYQHAIDQLVALMCALYKPPRGRRLIIDVLDMAATAPNSLDEWMHSARLVMDDYAKETVARAKELLHGNADWWVEARRVTYELGHGGHVWSVPIQIYTDDEGMTYKAGLLYNALKNGGEADLEIHNWFTDMTEERQHITMRGELLAGDPLDERNLEFYDVNQVQEMLDLANTRAPDPLPFAQMGEDRIAPGDDEQNPCTHPNRGIVLTCDTDFLSLTLLWYARYCFLNRAGPINCIDNAPLFSIGECQVLRTGWLQDAKDYYTRPLKRKAAAAATLNEDGTEAVPASVANELVGAPAVTGCPVTALEVWDVHRLWQMVSQCDVATNSSMKHLARVASFAVFCALCGNDYLAGLYFVSRVSMFAAYRKMLEASASPTLLVSFDNAEKLTVIVNPIVFVQLIKGSHWQQLMSLKGVANKPDKPVDRMSYSATARIVAAKYKDKKRHMPNADDLALIYQRLTWCGNYMFHGPQSNTEILDDNVWGWPAGTIERRV